MPTMPIVDTHVHLWDPSAVPIAWLAQVPALDRPFGLQDFALATEGLEIEAMVFLECDVDRGQHLVEADWVAGLAALEPRLRAMVAHAPLERGAVVLDDIELMARHGLLRGIRRLLQSEEPGFCLQDDFVQAVQMLPRFHLVFDLCVYHPQLPDAIELVRRCPGVTFVLDHMGKPGVKDGLLDPWRAHVHELAAMDNVVCKVSGLATEADHDSWTKEQLRPYIDHVVACFGFDRIMYGGDWPVSAQATTYRRWTEILDEALSGCSQEELDRFWRGNARRVYRLGQLTG
jgi:L-fuconolactonase